MKPQSFAIFLVVANVILLMCLVAQSKPDASQNNPAILRAQAIELVDEHGNVRAQLNVEKSGEAVFRLRDAKGAIRVKLGASEDGSGLLLLNDDTGPGVQALAKSKGTTLTLTNKDGRKRVVEP